MLSRKKILKALLLVLSVLLTTVQNSDEKEDVPAKFYDNPDTHLE